MNGEALAADAVQRPKLLQLVAQVLKQEGLVVETVQHLLTALQQDFAAATVGAQVVQLSHSCYVPQQSAHCCQAWPSSCCARCCHSWPQRLRLLQILAEGVAVLVDIEDQLLHLLKGLLNW